MLVETSNVVSAAPSSSRTHAPTGESKINPLRTLSFFSLVALSVGIEWRSLFATLNLAFRDEQYTQILLIMPITAILIYLDWPPHDTRAQCNSLLGFVLLASAAFVASFQWLCPAYLPVDLQLSFGMLVLVIGTTGAFVLCFGTCVARACLFPLCFLFGLVPIPQVALDVIVKLLQQGSSLAAYLLFVVAGIPVVRDGIMLTIPSLTIEVGKECSSIRSSSLLLVTTIVVAHIVLKSPWRKALAIGIAVPLSVAKNGLRIFTIGMLGTQVDPAYLNGRLHHQGGVVFFAISLAVVGILLWILRSGEMRGLSFPRTSQTGTSVGV
jgi:exosortase